MEPTTTAPQRSKTAGRRAILPCNGGLTRENCTRLKQNVMAEIRQQRSEVILDFKHVKLLDSAALETLVDLHEALEARGKALKIIRIQDLCRDILTATRLIHVLKVYKNLHGAITNSQ